eukprot:CAMPEP_0119528912 /NCGR_PEP_ID=MMETSP1344-20130328/42985_1 /TAXON_ID=236787 /ORGANISM="Florenciella parvula, Strain CCMP2471" /LENGTH=34 /DNA_ID= /DNA_START= /DNA_END= /DNA_ORIENTATION=
MELGGGLAFCAHAADMSALIPLHSTRASEFSSCI